MCENQSNGVHHGARFISAKAIKEYIPGISEIKKNLDQFRRVAFEFNQDYDGSEKINSLAPEKFNNTISILGQRGTGKTSAMMTLIKEISDGTYFMNDEDEDNSKSKKRKYKSNDVDIIFKIMDPEEMGEGSDFLGWIITSLEKYVDNIFITDKDIKECVRLNNIKSDNKNVKKNIQDLHESYISAKEEYSRLMYSKSNSLKEYNEKFKTMLNYDYEFRNKFNKVINTIVEIQREKNETKDLSRKEKEPLIFFFLDDVDTSSIQCPDILQNISSFLCHQNIVVCISGDYEVFQNSMTKYFLENNAYPQKSISDSDISDANARSEFYLKKVLPPTYRYKIVSYTNEILFNLKYNEEKAKDDDTFLSYNIYELISYVFKNGFEEKECRNNKYLDMFIIDEYKDSNKNKNENINDDCEENSRTNYIYAYLTIFGKNVRSFVNIYNYLYVNAVAISKLRRGSVKGKEYWNIEKFSEFINVLIESKYTYSQDRNAISKFLNIKYDQGDNKEEIYYIRNLRIDCEELKNLIKEIEQRSEQNNNYFDKQDYPYDKQGEIDSIIMLATFINELFYVIQDKEYRLRYKRIQTKLKKIICEFVNDQNNNIQILPTNLPFRDTLVFYYRIISRMDFNSLKAISKKCNYNDLYTVAETKKYFVQVFYAMILIYTSQNKEIINDLENISCKYLYDYYQKSTYAYKVVGNNKNINRSDFEKFIINKIRDYF